jgi:hypothetical protein
VRAHTHTHKYLNSERGWGLWKGQTEWLDKDKACLLTRKEKRLELLPDVAKASSHFPSAQEAILVSRIYSIYAMPPIDCSQKPLVDPISFKHESSNK